MDCRWPYQKQKPTNQTLVIVLKAYMSEVPIRVNVPRRRECQQEEMGLKSLTHKDRERSTGFTHAEVPRDPEKSCLVQSTGDKPSFNGSKVIGAVSWEQIFLWRGWWKTERERWKWPEKNESALALSFQHQKSVCWWELDRQRSVWCDGHSEGGNVRQMTWRSY